MKELKNKFIHKTERMPVVNQMFTDKHFRTIISATLSMIINLAYTVYNGFLGLIDGSIWFVTMFVYYAILFAMRCGVIIQGKGKDRTKDHLIMRVDGILLLALTISLTGIILLSMKFQLMKKHDTVIMITMVTYTLYKVVMAVINLSKGKHVASPIIRTIRDIGFADALVSLISTQMSMYATFGNTEDGRLMFIVTGAVVCALIATLAIAMIITSGRKKRTRTFITKQQDIK